MARKPFICGNWKMNTGIEEGIQLAEKTAIFTKSLTEEGVLWRIKKNETI